MTKLADGGFTVYKHTAPNGKVYIGITSKEPKVRWHGGNGYYHNEHFHNAIKKYGWDNITHEIIETDLPKDAACELEIRLIAQYNATNPKYGYNGTHGGEHFKPTAEAIERARQAHIGKRYNIGVPFTEERKRHMRENHADFNGANNPNYGKKWTPEQIAVRQAHRTYKRGGEMPNAKAILQYTRDGIFIKRWECIADACVVCSKTSIKDCLRGKYKVGGGFVWKYANEVNKNAD